jgi:hypothetical protein
MEELQIAINENLKYQKQMKRDNYTKPELFNAPNVITKHLLSNVWISVNKF